MRSAKTPRVLVVEDSEAIREMVIEALTEAGYISGGRIDGGGLEDVLTAFRPDVVVLDVMLPGRDGFALIDVVREWGDPGIVLLTARDALDDRVRGLDGGADDYVVKPFLLAELVSRVGAVLRRRGRLPSAIQLGDLVVDPEAGTASRAGQALELTATELRLLTYLGEQRNRIVSKEQILRAVWGYDAYDPNLVGVAVDLALGVQLRRDVHDRLVTTADRASALAKAGTPGASMVGELAGGNIRVRIITPSGASYGDPAIPATTTGEHPPPPPPPPPPKPGNPSPPPPPPPPPDATSTTPISDVRRELRIVMLLAGTELGRAASAFDGMLDALESAETRAHTAAHDAHVAAEQARRAESETRQFLSDAAHELRTPLAGIHAVAEQLATSGQAAGADQRQRRRASLLMRETARSARLVNDMLDIARIDSGACLLLEPTDLGALLAAELERARMLALRLTLHHTGLSTLALRADPVRLAQILSNLLDNARRHTPPGGTITAALAAADGQARLTITDTGPGVPDHEWERIFQRLVRLSQARDRDSGGAGLGLPLARGLARAHHGELTCLPAEHGAAFQLTLPLTPPD